MKRLFSAAFAFCALFTASGLMAAPGAASYKFDSSFGDRALSSGIAYLAIDSKDEICALLRNGEVKRFDTSGKELSSFSIDMEGRPDSIAIGDKGEIYVVTTKTVKKEMANNGRKFTRDVPVGVLCCIFDASGKKTGSLTLKDVVSGNAAKIVKNSIVIADYEGAALKICDLKTGKVTKKIDDGIRLCCGIFDFCEGPNDTLIIANLGAFKVQTYNLAGRKVGDFGERGDKIDQFHGCCNPVSVSCLADKSIVTVEKAPTRVKVYDKTGKKAEEVSGIQDFVKNCSHIPVVVDSKDNIYLGVPRQIVKCVKDSSAATAGAKK